LQSQIIRKSQKESSYIWNESVLVIFGSKKCTFWVKIKSPFFFKEEKDQLCWISIFEKDRKLVISVVIYQRQLEKKGFIKMFHVKQNWKTKIVISGYHSIFINTVNN
jgi:hypothetical protein